MASPFRVFRKHQKLMMAFLGIMAIIAFTVLGIVSDSQSTRRGEGGENPVVVTTDKYGDLTEKDIRRMQWTRDVLRNFLQEAVRRAGGENMAVWLKMNEIQQMFAPLSEQAVVDHWLLVQRAKELKMTVSDFTVTQFLRERTDNRLGGQDMADLYKQFGASEGFIFNALQEELLAMNMNQMLITSLIPATPEQRWDYFQRLNRKVDLEVLPVAVAPFVDAKEDPGDTVLKEFFDKYKDRFPSPLSPDPGFQIPQTVAIEYVKADISRFADPASVTDEEVKAYYEKNREQFRKVTLPGMDLDLGDVPAAKPPAAAAGSKAQGAPGTPAEPAAPTLPAPPETPADKQESQPSQEPTASPTPTAPTAAGSEPQEPKPAEPKAEEPKAEQPKPAEPKPEEPKPDEPKPDEPSAPPADKESSQSTVRPRFHLVSFAEDEAKKDAEPATAIDPQKPSAETPAATPAETPAASQPPAETPAPAAETPAPASGAVPEPPAGTTPPAAAPAGQPAAPTGPSEPAKQPATAAGATPPAVEYRSLDEVKDEIRNTLAREKVRDRILQGFQPIRANMTRHHKNVIAYEASKAEDEKTPARAPTFDMAALSDPPPGSYWLRNGWKLIGAEAAKAYKSEDLIRAERFGSPHRSGLLTEQELAKVDIAASRTEADQVFLVEVFGSMPSFLPGVSWDEEGNAYLYWKVKEVEQRVPKFDEPGVREKVLADWRFVQARKAALQHAEKLAKEAREAGTSLADSLGKRPGMTVSKTGPSTWMTTGTLPAMEYRNPPRISSVNHVDLAGDEFMRAAYSLDVGQIGVAMNHPQNKIYVMRLVDTSPLESVLLASFEVEDFGKYSAVAEGDLQKMVFAWLANLRRDAGLEWKRPAQRLDPRETRRQR